MKENIYILTKSYTETNPDDKIICKWWDNRKASLDRKVIESAFDEVVLKTRHDMDHVCSTEGLTLQQELLFCHDIYKVQYMSKYGNFIRVEWYVEEIELS